mgnify:CR=1 FL=1
MSKKVGFTLVESLVATLIFLIGVIGGFSYFFYAQTTLNIELHRRIAAEIVHSRLENLRTVSFIELPSYEEENTEVQIDKICGYRTTTIEDIDEDDDGEIDYRKITVRIRWDENGKEQNVEMVTFISQDRW